MHSLLAWLQHPVIEWLMPREMMEEIVPGVIDPLRRKDAGCHQGTQQQTPAYETPRHF
jgi:hypothetical protein